MRFLTLLFLFIPIISTGLYAQTPIDYSQAQNWAALPQQLPSGLARHCSDTSLWAKADVFYVYLTFPSQPGGLYLRVHCVLVWWIFSLLKIVLESDWMVIRPFSTVILQVPF